MAGERIVGVCVPWAGGVEGLVNRCRHKGDVDSEVMKREEIMGRKYKSQTFVHHHIVYISHTVCSYHTLLHPHITLAVLCSPSHIHFSDFFFELLLYRKPIHSTRPLLIKHLIHPHQDPAPTKQGLESLHPLLTRREKKSRQAINLDCISRCRCIQSRWGARGKRDRV